MQPPAGVTFLHLTDMKQNGLLRSYGICTWVISTIHVVLGFHVLYFLTVCVCGGGGCKLSLKLCPVTKSQNLLPRCTGTVSGTWLDGVTVGKDAGNTWLFCRGGN